MPLTDKKFEIFVRKLKDQKYMIKTLKNYAMKSKFKSPNLMINQKV